MDERNLPADTHHLADLDIEPSEKAGGSLYKLFRMGDVLLQPEIGDQSLGYLDIPVSVLSVYGEVVVGLFFKSYSLQTGLQLS